MYSFFIYFFFLRISIVSLLITKCKSISKLNLRNYDCKTVLWKSLPTVLLLVLIYTIIICITYFVDTNFSFSLIDLSTFYFSKKKKINFFACLRAALRFLCINPFQFLKPNHEVAQLSVMRSDICFCSNYAPRQAAAWGTQNSKGSWILIIASRKGQQSSRLLMAQ